MTCRHVSAPTLISKIDSKGQVLNGALTISIDDVNGFNVFNDDPI